MYAVFSAEVSVSADPWNQRLIGVPKKCDLDIPTKYITMLYSMLYYYNSIKNDVLQKT